MKRRTYAPDVQLGIAEDPATGATPRWSHPLHWRLTHWIVAVAFVAYVLAAYMRENARPGIVGVLLRFRFGRWLRSVVRAQR